MNVELINEAIKFATDKHASQVRKGTNMPYIVHPLEAGVIASQMTDDSEIIAAAFLHDTIEDTDTTKEELADKFGDNVAYLVSNESENKRKGTPEKSTWKTRKQETIDHIAKCTDERIKIIALADKLANLRAIYRDHNALKEEFWERFNNSNPADLKWYYSSFVETCKDLSDKEAYKEYAELIEKAFVKLI